MPDYLTKVLALSSDKVPMKTKAAATGIYEDYRVKSDIKVRGEHNVDTSRSHGSAIQREIKLLRRDFDTAKRELLQIGRESGDKDSPYVQDRETIDKGRLKDSPVEGEWRHVRHQSSRPLVKNIKKLNIL